MFVVVLIKVVKKYVVIPESWIYDVSEEKLKNNGVNRNQDVLIFWSNDAIGEDERPDGEYEPNFNLEILSVHPPTNGIAHGCYIGRIIRYFGKKNYLFIYVYIY